LFNKNEKGKEREEERQKGKTKLLWNNSRTTKNSLRDKPVSGYDLNVSDIDMQEMSSIRICKLI
jgi:hypothetical protein